MPRSLRLPDLLDSSIVPSAVRRAWYACFRRGRTPGLRTAKTTLAAIVSFVIADLLHTSDQPILAPLTALLVVQLTLYGTLTHGLDRIASVVTGVLVAVGVASLTGLTWWSLGAVVLLSLVVGRLMGLGPHLLEVPISAMLVLAAAGVGVAPLGGEMAETAAAGRVIETLIGAAVGIVVNVLIAPPLYIQPADDAISELVGKLSGFSRELAAAIRGDWSRAEADRFLQGARDLGKEVARADLHLARTEESARLNPRGRAAREARPRLRTALTGLEHCYVSLRNLSRAVLDRTFFVAEDDLAGAYSQEARLALADVVEAFADAMESIDPIASAGGSRIGTARSASGSRIGTARSASGSRIGTATASGTPLAASAAGSDAEDTRERAGERFAELKRCRDRLAGLLLVDPVVDPAAWEQHGALLAAVDRLRVEVEAAVRPSDQQWRPRPVTARQVAAMRRLFGARGARPAEVVGPTGARRRP